MRHHQQLILLLSLLLLMMMCPVSLLQGQDHQKRNLVGRMKNKATVSHPFIDTIRSLKESICKRSSPLVKVIWRMCSTPTTQAKKIAASRLLGTGRFLYKPRNGRRSILRHWCPD
ncbi:uncharacterized protein LOC144937516 [Lampetra fluviatilis]